MPDNAYSLGGAAIQGGLGVLGSGLQYLFNKRLAAQQNQYNIDMWNMQNEYNSPQAQMQRFQEAGLNPNLIYGQGNNGNSSQAPQMVVPDAPRVDKAMEELGKAFHLEQLRKLHYEAEAAKEASDSAAIDNANKRDERRERFNFAQQYYFDLTHGTIMQHPEYVQDVVAELTPKQRRDLQRLGALSSGGYFTTKYLSDYHKNLYLLRFRKKLLQKQAELLEPQINMQRFLDEHKGETYFIDKVSKPAGLIYEAGNHLQSVGDRLWNGILDLTRPIRRPFW